MLGGEVLDERTREILLEIGEFEEKSGLEKYIYSLYIVLLSGYVKKCLDKILENNPARWQRCVDREAEEKDTLKTDQ